MRFARARGDAQIADGSAKRGKISELTRILRLLVLLVDCHFNHERQDNSRGGCRCHYGWCRERIIGNAWTLVVIFTRLDDFEDGESADGKCFLPIDMMGETEELVDTFFLLSTREEISTKM